MTRAALAAVALSLLASTPCAAIEVWKGARVQVQSAENSDPTAAISIRWVGDDDRESVVRYVPQAPAAVFPPGHTFPVDPPADLRGAGIAVMYACGADGRCGDTRTEQVQYLKRCEEFELYRLATESDYEEPGREPGTLLVEVVGRVACP